ncbi:MAG: cyanophycinase [Sarcina sp.]
MDKNDKENLIIIGGAEDKKRKKTILRYVASKISGDEELLIATVASEVADLLIKDYKEVFGQLSVKNIKELNINKREECWHEEKLNLIDSAKVIFFTGGDQLRITSLIGGTPIYKRVIDAFNKGTILVGTSAGASVMSDTMIVSGDDEESPRKCTIEMARGLGLVKGLVIDQHFSQRGRIGRLLAAVAQNPESIGIGIDEDTAIVLGEDNIIKVIGSNSVYIIDGRKIDYSNVSEQSPKEQLSMFNVILHILTPGKSYNLDKKKPFEEEVFKNEDN